MSLTIRQMLDQKGWGAIVLKSRQPIPSVAQCLTENKIGAAPVVDDDGRLVGMLSERDISRAVGQAADKVAELVAEDLMTKLVTRCGPDDDVVEIMRTMTSTRRRHIPVMQGEQLLGIVSIGDVVKARLEETEFEVDSLRSYITSP
jgi:CBS domain-containing protein